MAFCDEKNRERHFLTVIALCLVPTAEVGIIRDSEIRKLRIREFK